MEEAVEDNKKKKRFVFFRRSVVVCNYFAVAGLIASYLAPLISPQKVWFLAFFGLSYPIWLFLNIGFMIFWIVTGRKKFLISLIAVLIGYPMMKKIVQISPGSSVEIAKAPLKVMSYNVKVFDLYNWSHCKDTRDKMFDLISVEAPDILCLQEFYTDDSKKFNTLDTLQRFQKAKYVHAEYLLTLLEIYHHGIATFSSYPIVNKGRIMFPENNSNICIYTDIKINDDTVRVYNMHLQSIRFIPEEYKYIDEIKKDVNKAEDIEKSKSILRRLKNAFEKRAVQADLINESIRRCKYPILLCGDFNDTPSSYAYHTIAGDLDDAFVKSGFGLGRTYIGSFPSFRIDYILHSSDLKSYEFRTLPEEYTDHHPISCYLEIQK